MALDAINHAKKSQFKALEAFYHKRDIFACLPTGYGKSLIFQLSPFVAQIAEARKQDDNLCISSVNVKECDRITLVITPLNSIMKDQVMSLVKNGISACYLDMTMASGETYSWQNGQKQHKDDSDNETEDPMKVLKEQEADDEACDDTVLQCTVSVDEAISGKYRLIYSHPEAFLSNQKGKKLLHLEHFTSKVCCIAIDEAHMIQEWGEEFRSDFSRLSTLMVCIPDTPVMVMTATASKLVMDSLIDSLELDSPLILSVNPDRPNIMYTKTKRQVSSRTKDDLDLLLKDLYLELDEKRIDFPITLVYTDLDSIDYCYEYLSYAMKERQYEGDACPEHRLFAQYHRYYSDRMKTMIVSDLCSNTSKIRLIFATIALGMGLNALHIRRVIHFKPPTSIEKYMQETGRAGRDGFAADAILYYNNQDVRSNRPGIKDTMIKYCKSEDKCLRNQLLSCLGYEANPNRDQADCCSFCKCNRNATEM